MNTDLFSRMSEYIYNEEKKQEEPECDHDFIVADFHVCQKCGLVSDKTIFAPEADEYDRTRRTTKQSKTVTSKINRATYKRLAIKQFLDFTSQAKPPLIFEDRPYELGEIIEICNKNKISQKTKFHYFYKANKIKNGHTMENFKLIQSIVDKVFEIAEGNLFRVCFYIYFKKLGRKDIASLILPVITKKSRKIIKSV